MTFCLWRNSSYIILPHKMQLSSRLAVAFLVTGTILAVLLSADTTAPVHNQYLKEQINNVLQSLNEGQKTELVLPPFDPLTLESMIIEEGPNMLPVNLRLSNVTIRGLSKLRVTEAKNDRKKLEITYYIDRLEIEGNYDLNANLMIMPITANGPCAFIYENMTVTLAADLREMTKEGKTYYQVENMTVFDNPENFTMNLQNLISGEAAYDSIMNKFLNKNFKPLIAKSMSKAHEQLYVGIANMILSQIPIDINQRNTKEL
ncbi:protein takeout isoform X2 [Halyomorpha halys]|uniref:protein takeout isoform X2 n=1 Tax=Halyomorpha halys TaxID=286706 RepID=UPI0006D4CDBF|nr:protein takeout isoform X2 [Halyomorpha halys]